MYQESEQLMANYMEKLLKSRGVKKGKEVISKSGKIIKDQGKEAPNTLVKLIKNILSAILLMPIALFIMPFVDAFKSDKAKKPGMLDNFKRDTK